jgi:hypothetical protein
LDLEDYSIIEDEMNIQEESDLIQSYFHTTTEPYDSLEWDGKELLFILDKIIIEIYSKEELSKIIKDFE